MHATWILPDGRTITAPAPEGQNLMEAAVRAGVPGILGDCGGTMSCATCHVHVDPAWAAAAGEPSAFEAAMLDVVEGPRAATSRLSCQIAMTAARDGIVLRVPGAG